MEFIEQFDQTIFQLVSSWSCPFADRIFTFFSAIGDFGLIWLFFIFCVLFSRKYRYYGVTALVALALSMVVVHLFLKPGFARPRPFELYEGLELLIAPPFGSSFPSGHAASSFAVASCLFAANRKLGGYALVIAAIISLSRIYLFVHFPSDVLAGAVIGALCALLMLVVKKFTLNRIPRLR